MPTRHLTLEEVIIKNLHAAPIGKRESLIVLLKATGHIKEADFIEEYEVTVPVPPPPPAPPPPTMMERIKSKLGMGQ